MFYSLVLQMCANALCNILHVVEIGKVKAVLYSLVDEEDTKWCSAFSAN